MHIVIFGANGRVGSKVVTQLLENGHSVKAFVHGNSNLADHEKLEVIYGDIRDISEVYAAVTGTDAVISTLGSWGTKSKDILTSGMLSIIPAMENQNIKRIISLTGAGAFIDDEKRNIIDTFSHFAMGLFAGKVLRDGENHMRLLQNTDLDWTVLRSPIMKEESTKEKYVLSNSPPLLWATIPRDHVVQGIVRLIETNEYTQQAPFISRQ